QVAFSQVRSVLWSTRRQQVGFSILDRNQSSDMLRLIVGLTCLWLLVHSGSNQVVENKPVTEDCLDCLCETMSGCNASAICVNGACGIFRITWGYWVEAGKLTLPTDSALSDDAFTNCVNEPHCAANTVQNYMFKHGQDCNGDDHIDCLDFGALHKLGNLQCRGELPNLFGKVFNQCLKAKKRLAEKKIIQAKETAAST
ncbi:lysozyme 3, partial [Drosophila elegans]|uniref:lysozyme 3 n=1 Tax=Drosophila elegans TaxID=30023 RepID=UPI0007E76C42